MPAKSISRHRPFYFVTAVAILLLLTIAIHSHFSSLHISTRLQELQQSPLSPTLHSVSPLPSLQDEQQPPWLIANMIPYFALQRRHIIRATWQALFHSPSHFRPIFVVLHPTPAWQPLLAAENEQYGDILILDHLEESSHTANTVKSIEFLKYLDSTYSKSANGLPWKFVSKIDDDSYLDASRFWDNYLQPLLEETARPNRTAIGRTLRLEHGEFTYPGGQFYTLTSDMVQTLAALHTANPITDEHEDVLIGRLLYEGFPAPGARLTTAEGSGNHITLEKYSESGAGSIEWTHMNLPNEVAFDYVDVDTRPDSALAKEGAALSGWTHAVGRDAVNPHKMREDEDYLKVAACFDENGVITQS